VEKVFYQIFSKNDLYLAKSSQKIEFFFGVNSPFFLAFCLGHGNRVIPECGLTCANSASEEGSHWRRGGDAHSRTQMPVLRCTERDTAMAAMRPRVLASSA